MIKNLKQLFETWIERTLGVAVRKHVIATTRSIRDKGPATCVSAIGSDQLDAVLTRAVEIDAKYPTYGATDILDRETLRMDLYRLVCDHGRYVRATRGLLDQALATQRVWDENVALQLAATHSQANNAAHYADMKRKLEAARKELRALKQTEFKKTFTKKKNRLGDAE
jgi:hypothetical protein